MRIGQLLDNLPLGKAPFLILVAAVLSGAYLAVHPVRVSDAALSFWLFADMHQKAYEEADDRFAQNHDGAEVDIKLLTWRAIHERMRAALWADLEVPDLVELEITQVGTFFRGPEEDIGFVDFTDYLKESGFYDRIVQNRFSAYTHRGRIYGIPLDVHPVMLAYRRDIFQDLGVDVTRIKTWDEFIELGREITIPGERYMMELSDAGSTEIELFLFQRGGGYFDSDGNLTLDSELAYETLLWYVPLVAGPGRIGSTLGQEQAFTQAIEGGYFLTLLCPDWRTWQIQNYAGNLEGKMALMPLPAFEPGGRRTSTRGGTMVSITKASDNQDLAWDYIKEVCLSPQHMEARFRNTNIIPQFKDAWDLEIFSEPHPYWSNQKIGEMYVALAEDVPPQYASPFLNLAKNKFGEVVSSCANYYRRNGEEGFAEFARQRLDEAAADVRRMMKRNPF